ncbi:unnamed protein product [Linum tenue]|uniref:Uncharacterized protein n=1 Tax=Linum tenue TaxID=586396 RepID=A0AAV0RTH7_9ROSI|nr:unnamed protein product [Linum tenue]
MEYLNDFSSTYPRSASLRFDPSTARIGSCSSSRFSFTVSHHSDSVKPWYLSLTGDTSASKVGPALISLLNARSQSFGSPITRTPRGSISGSSHYAAADRLARKGFLPLSSGSPTATPPSSYATRRHRALHSSSHRRCSTALGITRLIGAGSRSSRFSSFTGGRTMILFTGRRCGRRWVDSSPSSPRKSGAATCLYPTVLISERKQRRLEKMAGKVKEKG